MINKRELLEEGEAAQWIYTFADMMTLLLVFFVLMFALSSSEDQKMDEVLRSLNNAFAVSEGGNSIISMPHNAPVATSVPDEIGEQSLANDVAEEQSEHANRSEVQNQDIALNHEMKQLGEELNQKFQITNPSAGIEVGQPKDGKVTIRVEGSTFFSSGSAQYNREMMTVMDNMVLMLKQNPDLKVNILGHTDDIPIQSSRFPTNWELSAVRATTVLRYFVRGGVAPSRVLATGYGDSVPLVANNSSENRAKNRRLEFVLEKINK